MSDEFGETVDAWAKTLPPDKPQCTCTSRSGDNPQGHSRGCPRRTYLEDMRVIGIGGPTCT